MDIAHPQFWTDKAGSRPSPFTTITCEDVKNGTWLPVQEEHTVSYNLFLEVSLATAGIAVVGPIGSCMTRCSIGEVPAIFWDPALVP